MPPKPRDETWEWLRYASEDLDSAEILLNASPPHLLQALFGAQQRMEKALKAFLIGHHRPYPLSHNLGLLCDLCEEIDPSVPELADPDLVLTDFAMRFRYPGTMPEAITVEDAREWIETARRVYAAVVDRLR
jgi:HEPN domain-containing protein